MEGPRAVFMFKPSTVYIILVAVVIISLSFLQNTLARVFLYPNPFHYQSPPPYTPPAPTLKGSSTVAPPPPLPVLPAPSPSLPPPPEQYFKLPSPPQHDQNCTRYYHDDFPPPPPATPPHGYGRRSSSCHGYDNIRPGPQEYGGESEDDCIDIYEPPPPPASFRDSYGQRCPADDDILPGPQ